MSAKFLKINLMKKTIKKPILRSIVIKQTYFVISITSYKTIQIFQKYKKKIEEIERIYFKDMVIFLE